MTEQLEHYLHAAFLEDAQNAPQATDLAQSARRRAGAQRRRRAGLVGGALVAVVGAASLSSVMWSPLTKDVAVVQPATETVPQPNFTGPLTREEWECPKNRNAGAGGFLGDSRALPSAEDQTRQKGDLLVVNKYPDAQMVPGPASADQKEFFYVLPNGKFVAVFEFELIPAGWYLKGMAYC